MNYRERIVRDPHIAGGEPVLKGTRVTLRTVLATLAEGATTADILADFPTLSEEDVRAAIAFAAGSGRSSTGGGTYQALKIKLDENLPERLVSELSQLGHDVDTVRTEHLAGQTDEQVWRAAQSANRFSDHPRPRFFRHAALHARDARRFAVRTSLPPWSGCIGGARCCAFCN